MRKKSACQHRVGLGFDSHAFSRSGSLVLGGIIFKGTPRLEGHSDGDALLHAIVDALLGAAGMGDIGEHFPDTDPAIRGMDSRVMVRRTISALEKKKFVIRHLDLVVVLKRPHLMEVKNSMRAVLASLLKVSKDAVNIKAKTPEGLNLFGPKGGVAVWAQVLMDQK